MNAMSAPPWRTVTVILLLGLLSACGGDDQAGKGEPWKVKDPDQGADMATLDMGEADMAGEEIRAPRRPVAIETVVSRTEVRAGEAVEVVCQWLDQYGEAIPFDQLDSPPPFDVRRTPPSALTLGDIGSDVTDTYPFTATQAGDVLLTCASQQGGAVDATPARLVIKPGAAHTVVTTVDRRTMSAGEAATVSCATFDAYGNPIADAQPSVVTDVQGSAVAIAGDQVTITSTGVYTVSCQVDGAPEQRGSELEVTPGLPASLMISAQPVQNVYGLGQVITVATTVTDQFDNLVPAAPLEFTNTTGGVAFGSGRWRFNTEGVHTITARVLPPTFDARVLEASVDVTINGNGPDISCLGPVNGEMVNAAPGAQVTFQGKVADTNGVDLLVVNGNDITPAADGTFSLPITARYGINFVDLVSRDQFGAENSKTCAFLVSDRWAPEGQRIGDGISLKLNQSAIDDNVTTDGLDSLNDVLLKVLNSTGLESQVDAALRAANPLKPSDCDVPTFLGCLFRSRVDYLDSAINKPGKGPHTTKLDLVTNGLRLKARLNNFSIRLEVEGTVDTSGWVDFDYVEVDLTSNLRLVNGRPKVSLRQINSVSVGEVDPNLSGLGGVAADIFSFFFQNTLRDLVRDIIRDAVEQQFNAALDGIVSGLDVSSLGTSLNVPRLDGTGNVALGFNVSFDTLQVSAARALFGLGAGFTAPITRAGTTRGAAMPGGNTLLDISTTRPIAAAIHVGIINQILHALWRAQFFDATISGDTLSGDLPDGSRIDLSMELPPVLVLKGKNKVELHLGAARVGLVYPGVFDDPLTVGLGAVGFTGIIINGDALQFTNIQLSELYFSPEGVSLDASSRDVLESFLRTLVQGLIDRSLNNALPSLPIPSFALPASMTQYGLPANAELGIIQPALDNSTTHYTLDGAFGLR